MTEGRAGLRLRVLAGLVVFMFATLTTRLWFLQVLAAEERQNALFDKRLAQEEAWIRKGIEARRTRNEGRVRALKALRCAERDVADNCAENQLHVDHSSGCPGGANEALACR